VLEGTTTLEAHHDNLHPLEPKPATRLRSSDLATPVGEPLRLEVSERRFGWG